jgi:hypothetical protein
MTVWRGVRLDLRKDYEVGKTYTWWGFSSCTGSISVLKSDMFLGQEGKRTMFSIECFNGKKIRDYSSFYDEDEILLLPSSQFIVKDHFQPAEKDPDLIIIHLKQVEPPFILLEEPSQGMVSPIHGSTAKASPTHDSTAKTPPIHDSTAKAPSTHDSTAKVSAEDPAHRKYRFFLQRSRTSEKKFSMRKSV